MGSNLPPLKKIRLKISKLDTGKDLTQWLRRELGIDASTALYLFYKERVIGSDTLLTDLRSKSNNEDKEFNKLDDNTRIWIPQITYCGE